MGFIFVTVAHMGKKPDALCIFGIFMSFGAGDHMAQNTAEGTSI